MKKNILSIAAFLGLTTAVSAQNTSIVLSPGPNGTMNKTQAGTTTSAVVFKVSHYQSSPFPNTVDRIICGEAAGGALSGLPTGVTATLATTANGSTATYTISAGPTAVAGSFTLTIDVTKILVSTSANCATSAVAVYDATQGSSPNGTVTFALTLPIELTSFEGVTEGNKVNLAWATASEKENVSFDVERSYDAVNFTTVGTVKGSGTTNEAHNYAFTDATATGTIAYYRLKDTDLGGQSKYSNVIGVKLGKGSKLEVGVIATDLGLVTYNSMEEGNATLQVVNLSGQVVAQAQATATEGNNVVPMNLNALANGIYLLQVRTANSTVTKKFVKN